MSSLHHTPHTKSPNTAIQVTSNPEQLQPTVAISQAIVPLIKQQQLPIEEEVELWNHTKDSDKLNIFSKLLNVFKS